MIRVVLPAHLKTLARVDGEVVLPNEVATGAMPFLVVGAMSGG